MLTLRQQEIHTWLSSLLPAADLSAIQNIQADASQRKYLRLQTPENSWVIMDTKPDQEIINFNQLATILLAQKVKSLKLI